MGLPEILATPPFVATHTAYSEATAVKATAIAIVRYRMRYSAAGTSRVAKRASCDHGSAPLFLNFHHHFRIPPDHCNARERQEIRLMINCRIRQFDSDVDVYNSC